MVNQKYFDIFKKYSYWIYFGLNVVAFFSSWGAGDAPLPAPPVALDKFRQGEGIRIWPFNSPNQLVLVQLMVLQDKA